MNHLAVSFVNLKKMAVHVEKDHTHIRVLIKTFQMLFVLQNLNLGFP